MQEHFSGSKYLVTSALMGFGHLRAAHNIASYSKTPVLRVDKDPYVNLIDKFIWRLAQYTHSYASRDTESRSKFLYRRFEKLMEIPDDHRSPSLRGAKFVRRLQKLGAGKKVFNSFDGASPTLLHTFYLPAMLSVYYKYTGGNFLLLCDTDFHRVWVPLKPEKRNLKYCVPMVKSADTLISYGVSKDKIYVTGFPLPVANTGGRDLRQLAIDFEVRKKRLRHDSSLPLTIMFPFSGAGAYSNVLADLVKSILDELKEGSLRLIVSCGDNDHALKNAENLFTNYGIDELEFAEIMYDKDIFASFDKFDSALKATDVMITKPSEMVFYAALGIPLLFLPPIGAHEAKNRDYLFGNRCAVNMVPPSDFPRWLEKRRRNGTLVELAENGHRNLPQTGTFEIDELVAGTGN